MYLLCLIAGESVSASALCGMLDGDASGVFFLFVVFPGLAGTGFLLKYLEVI